MYRIRKNGIKQCSVEFGFWETRKRRINILKKLVYAIQDDERFFGGEICGIDFNVEKVLQKLKTKETSLQIDRSDYAILRFFTQEDSDFEMILNQFDSFSEGFYTLYLLPKDAYRLNDENVDFQKNKDYLLRLSVYADATYVEFDFADELICNRFMEIN